MIFGHSKELNKYKTKELWDVDSEIVDQQIRLIDTSQKKNGLALNTQHVDKNLCFMPNF